MRLYLNVINYVFLNKSSLETREEEISHILLIGQLLQIEGDLHCELHVKVQLRFLEEDPILVRVEKYRLPLLKFEDLFNVLMRYNLPLKNLIVEDYLHASLHLLDKMQLVVNAIDAFLASPVHLRNVKVCLPGKLPDIVKDLLLKFESKRQFSNHLRLLYVVHVL